MGVRRTIATRAGWGLADQAFSSLTNFALSLVIARAVTASEFGAFSLAFATYLLGMGVVRAVVAQPLVIRYATTAEDSWRRGAAAGTGAALTIGLACAAIAAVASVVLGGALAAAFGALALTFPGLLIQDSWRFAFLAKGTPKAALVNDVVWALVLFPLLGIVAATGTVSVFTATLAWGGSATVAALYGIVQSRAVPRVSQSSVWFREHRDVIPSYIGEFGATAGAQQAAMFGVGLVTNLVVVAALRAAEVLMGPLKTLYQGLRMVAQPEAVRALARGRELARPCLLFSAALAGMAAVAGVVLLALPDSIGRAVLGDSWEPAQAILLPYSISVAASGALSGAQMGLHAMVAVRRSLVTRVTASVLLVALKVIGAITGGAYGAAVGGAIATWAGAGLWWWQFSLARREYHAAPREATSLPPADPDLLNPDASAADP